MDQPKLVTEQDRVDQEASAKLLPRCDECNAEINKGICIWWKDYVYCSEICRQDFMIGRI